MSLFDHWPFQTSHELNLDWIIRKMKEWGAQAAADVAAAKSAAKTAADNAAQGAAPYATAAERSASTATTAAEAASEAETVALNHANAAEAAEQRALALVQENWPNLDERNFGRYRLDGSTRYYFRAGAGSLGYRVDKPAHTAIADTPTSSFSYITPISVFDINLQAGLNPLDIGAPEIVGYSLVPTSLKGFVITADGDAFPIPWYSDGDYMSPVIKQGVINIDTNIVRPVVGITLDVEYAAIPD